MATLSTSEEVVGALRQAVAQQSRGPRHIVDAYLNLLSSDPLLHIRIRELRERAFATARRRPHHHHPHTHPHGRGPRPGAPHPGPHPGPHPDAVRDAVCDTGVQEDSVDTARAEPDAAVSDTDERPRQRRRRTRSHDGKD